jgi:hypothetical protein
LTTEPIETGSTSRAPASVAVARLDDQLAWYDAKSGSAQRAYKRVKTAELVVAAAVPVVAGVGAPPLLTAALGAVVVLAEGILQLYGWQTNWTLYRGTAEALTREKYLHLAQAGPYVGADRDRVLAERVEELVSQEHAKWIETRSRSGGQQDEGAATGTV